MRTEKKLYREAVLEVVCAFDADIITTSSDIIDSGADGDEDAGFGNVAGGDSWDA